MSCSLTQPPLLVRSAHGVDAVSRAQGGAPTTATIIASATPQHSLQVCRAIPPSPSSDFELSTLCSLSHA